MLASPFRRPAHRGLSTVLSFAAIFALAACQRTIPFGDADGSASDVRDVFAADSACASDRCVPSDAIATDAPCTSDTCPQSDARVSCSTAGDCRACGALTGCGWCAASGRCVEGDRAGAADGSCAAATWVWEPTHCPATTCDARDCLSCMGQSGCGWCAASGRCMPGGADGAFGGACEASQWAYLQAQCPNACATEPSNCTSCQARSGCGWCGSTESCVPSNADGTGPATGACGEGTWVPSFGVCAPETDTCTNFSDCGSCAGPMGSANGCGWCRTRGASGRCVTRAAGNCPEDAWADACTSGG